MRPVKEFCRHRATSIRNAAALTQPFFLTAIQGETMIGLVLAGGKSSRLGQDKTRVVHEGQTLLTRTATLLERHVDQVYISSRQDIDTGGHWPVILDETERIGPAGGIITALRRLGGPSSSLPATCPSWRTTSSKGFWPRGNAARASAC